jgi:hypothetical protein
LRWASSFLLRGCEKNQFRSESVAKPDWQGAKREKFGRIAGYVAGFFPFRNAARLELAAFAVGFDFFTASQPSGVCPRKVLIVLRVLRGFA